MGLTKTGIKAELQANGLWNEFVRLREEEKLRGRTAWEAWQVAYERVKLGEVAAAGVKKKMDVPAKVKAKPEEIGAGLGEETVQRGSDVEGLGPRSAAMDPSVRSENAEAAPIRPPDSSDEILAVVQARKAGKRDEVGSVVGELYSKERVREAFGEKAKATKKAEDEWVEANIDVAVELEDAPSMSAWSRLMRVRHSADLMRDFYRAMMAARASREEVDRFEDDGRDNIELIERCEHAIHSSGAEGVGGESEVSAEGD